MDEPKPMFVERDDRNDVVAYHVLCPKCKQYTVLYCGYTYDQPAIRGEARFRCKSAVCMSSTLLEIVQGRAVIVNNFPKADVQEVKKNAKSVMWKGVYASSFTNLPRNTQN